MCGVCMDTKCIFLNLVKLHGIALSYCSKLSVGLRFLPGVYMYSFSYAPTLLAAGDGEIAGSGRGGGK